MNITIKKIKRNVFYLSAQIIFTDESKIYLSTYINYYIRLDKIRTYNERKIKKR